MHRRYKIFMSIVVVAYFLPVTAMHQTIETMSSTQRSPKDVPAFTSAHDKDADDFPPSLKTPNFPPSLSPKDQKEFASPLHAKAMNATAFLIMTYSDEEESE